MPRSYRHISDYEKEIINLREQGKTRREICDKYGFSNPKTVLSVVRRKKYRNYSRYLHKSK